MAKKEPFEKSLKDLESAVEKLENGDLPLEEALACFETGIRSAKLCQKHLKEVETKVEILLKDKQGDFSTEDFPDRD